MSFHRPQTALETTGADLAGALAKMAEPVNLLHRNPKLIGYVLISYTSKMTPHASLRLREAEHAYVYERFEEGDEFLRLSGVVALPGKDDQHVSVSYPSYEVA